MPRFFMLLQARYYFFAAAATSLLLLMPSFFDCCCRHADAYAADATPAEADRRERRYAACYTPPLLIFDCRYMLALMAARLRAMF